MKITHQLRTVTQQECRQICTFDSPLKGCELKSTMAGKLFHTFTMLLAKKFVLALLAYCELYN